MALWRWACAGFGCVELWRACQGRRRTPAKPLLIAVEDQSPAKAKVKNRLQSGSFDDTDARHRFDALTALPTIIASGGSLASCCKWRNC